MDSSKLEVTHELSLTQCDTKQQKAQMWERDYREKMGGKQQRVGGLQQLEYIVVMYESRKEQIY